MFKKQLIKSGAMKLSVAMLASVCFAGPTTASAETWPTNQPINVIVPFSPGGFTDLIARRFANDLGNALGANVVVQNRAGASGQIGSAYVSRAKPDGYTLLITATQHVIYPGLQPELPYDPRKDFSNIAILAYAPNVLLVPAESSISSAQEFTEYTKQQEGGVSFGSSSVGGSAHLSGELYKMVTGANLQHIPYKGAAPALTDLVGGQVPSGFLDATSAAAFIRSGQIKALAVTSRHRLPSLPDVPTVAESGYPSYEAEAWIGMFGPADLPAHIVEKINEIAIETTNTQENIDWLIANNATPSQLTAPAVTEFVFAELDKWQQVIDEAELVTKP